MKPEKKINKDKMKLAAANVDSNLFCKLFIASEARKGNIEEFFKHENSRYPPALSEFGGLRQLGANDSLVHCLFKEIGHLHAETSAAPHTDSQVQASTLIMDVFCYVQSKPPDCAMTVKDYSENIINKLIDTKLEKYTRVDALFDVNCENSLEEMTKDVSGEAKYIVCIDNDTKLQKGKIWFTKFLSKTKTKVQFMKILAANYSEHASKNNYTISGVAEHIIISEASDMNVSLPIENLNARMLLHAEDAVRNGHQRVLLCTSDVNIVNVALYAFKCLAPKIEKMWIDNVHDKGSKIVSIHELYGLHENKCDALPFFDAFTGCPTTSTFFGIGKVSAWNAWMKFPSVTSAIVQLMNDGTPALSDEAMNTLEEFTVKMYDSSSKMTKLHDCRRDLFTRKTKARTIDRIPPTRDALEQHVKRSILQTKIWSQCLAQNIQELDPADWGWMKKFETNKYDPVWTSIPIVADHCMELIACKCTKKCTGHCKCKKNHLPCTMLCLCDGKCLQTND